MTDTQTEAERKQRFTGEFTLTDMDDVVLAEDEVSSRAPGYDRAPYLAKLRENVKKNHAHAALVKKGEAKPGKVFWTFEVPNEAVTTAKSRIAECSKEVIWANNKAVGLTWKITPGATKTVLKVATGERREGVGRKPSNGTDLRAPVNVRPQS